MRLPARAGRRAAGLHCTEVRYREHGLLNRPAREGHLQEALSVYRVDAALLRSLGPDVIVTKTQCEVPAVSPRDVVKCLSTWTQEVVRPAPRMVALEPNLIEDVWADVRCVAEALDVARRRDWSRRRAIAWPPSRYERWR